MKKKLLSLALALALCMGLSVPAFAAELKIVQIPVPTVDGFEITKYYGFGNFHDGLAQVWNSVPAANSPMDPLYIDRTGKVVISPAGYNRSEGFSEGFARVEKNGKFGFIDKTGKEITPFQYSWALSFSEGFAAVQRGGKWGFIDTTGKEAVSCTYDDVYSFTQGLAAVQKGGKWGFIGKTREEVIPFQYDDTTAFSQGLAGVEKNGKWGYIDKTGEVVIDFQYDGAGTFANGLAPVRQSGKWGYIDKTGELVILCTFDSAGYFSEGLAVVTQNGLFGYIDTTGKVVVPCKYANAAPFSEGFAAVKAPNTGTRNIWGFIDKTGKEVVPPTTYTEDDGEYFILPAGSGVPSFSEGYAAIRRGGDGWKDYYEDRYFYFVITVDAEVSDWAREQVDSAAVKGLMPDGLGDDFTVNITRAEFAALAVKLYEAMSGETAPAPGESPFSDTNDPVIIQANALGIVYGDGGKFSPDGLLTRQELAVMLSRVYTKLGGEIPEATAIAFADNDKVSSWAMDAVAFMSSREIMNGVGGNRFDPTGNASIEQALAIALRMFENLK